MYIINLHKYSIFLTNFVRMRSLSALELLYLYYLIQYLDGWREGRMEQWMDKDRYFRLCSQIGK